MAKMPPGVKEAQEYTGRKLRVTSVPKGIAVPLGFVGVTTRFHLHWFEGIGGEAITWQTTDSTYAWHVVKPLSGTTLGMWTDPHGYKHSFLFQVAPRVNALTPTMHFAVLQHKWRVMGDMNATYSQVQRAVSGAGLRLAATAIQFARWLRGTKYDRSTVAAFAHLAVTGSLDQVRKYLVETPFNALPDRDLTNVLLGAEQYAKTLSYGPQKR